MAPKKTNDNISIQYDLPRCYAQRDRYFVDIFLVQAYDTPWSSSANMNNVR